MSEGYKPLREWLQGEMGRIGIDCTPDNIFITSGSQQALDYIGKLFLSPRDTALVGWPTYLGALQAFNAYEPTFDQLTLSGNRTPESYRSAARKAGGEVKFAYLSSDFANPTGETIDRAGRERLLDIAEELNIAVIEDAAYHICYEGEAIPRPSLEIARKGSFENTRTIYCGSFPRRSRRPAGRLCGRGDAGHPQARPDEAGADLHSSTINQIAIAHVAERHFDEQVAKIRVGTAPAENAMLAALDRYMPAARLDEAGWRHVHMGHAPTVWTDRVARRSVETEKVAFVPGQPSSPTVRAPTRSALLLLRRRGDDRRGHQAARTVIGGVIAAAA